MKFNINIICAFVLLVCGISSCQSTRYYSLHFHDKKSDVFYLSDTSLINSIDTCFVIKDTLHIVLSPPILMKESNREYYRVFRKPYWRYTEKLPISDSLYNLNYYPYIMLENYYCTRIFKRKKGCNYYQESSIIQSSHLVVPTKIP